MGWDMSPMLNNDLLIEVHGYSRGTGCVASSIIIVGGTVRGLVRDRCYSVGGAANRVRVVFPVAPIRPRKNI